jgi:glycosyltransferase involved in cell wall biosynthesis
MKKHTVDILLATYNGFSYVASQLDSILAQTHKDIRLIIRDDASQDSTRKVLEAYANRYPDIITLLPSDISSGVKGNFSCLMQHATADYIMFADQDDLWEEGKVAKTLQKMQELEDRFSSATPLLVHTDLKVVDRNLNVLCQSFWKYGKIDPLKGHSLNRLLMQNVVTGCTMMINRSLLDLGGPIPEKAAMHDWWLALVAAAFGHIEALLQTTLMYRQHGANALGAQKFLSLGHFKKGMNRINEPEIAKQAHVDALLARYSEFLTYDQKQMLKAYKKLPGAFLFKKFYLILRYKFFKMGFLRNAVNILAKKQ